MLISDIFENDITRDINPVVYFHEQEPARVAEEVGEYIITGGYDMGDPRRVEHGIHEQFVRLLQGIGSELGKPKGPELPAAWISGFYGSGKSSFAKLLGLSLNGVKLPDGTLLAEALLKRDGSPMQDEFREAWQAVLDKVKPMAVVFDIGSVARDNEHIHAAVVRQCQRAMGYCDTSSLVADHELKLEADGLYDEFLSATRRVHKKPWEELKGKQLAEDHFSATLHALAPTLYPNETAWIDANAGRRASRSAEECVKAIEQMLTRRRAGRTLFLVVDEVSQYVHDNSDRRLALESFVSALGQRLRGKAWILATGQQQLEEGASATTHLVKMKDRFPAHLRVHLSSANIRDVVHQRLLKKKTTVRRELEQLYADNRSDLALYAYKGSEIQVQDFMDVYPMLPGHIDLLMAITTGLRTLSSRGQGDSHAIRGLLQLLGDIFRLQDLGRFEVGTLLTLDRVYDVLHTALDADIQTTLGRAFAYCSKNLDDCLGDPKLAERALKAVSLLGLIQDESTKVDVELVGRCLYERLGQGSQSDALQQALDSLRAASFLDYSEKTGFKIQSSAGQEWQRERDRYEVGSERISGEVQQALTWLMTDVTKADLEGIGIPWQGWFSDSVSVSDALVKQERSPTKIEVDFRYLTSSSAQRKEEWVPRSGSEQFKHRIIWVAGELTSADLAAREHVRSTRMVERYANGEASLAQDKRRLLTEERNRQESAREDLKRAVEKAFLGGTLYFQGTDRPANEEGATFAAVLKSFGDRAVQKMYPAPVTFRVTEKDTLFLIESADLAAPPPVLGDDKLGLLVLDSGRFEATCTGAVPSEIYKSIEGAPGITGGSLLTRFGGPPHGYTSDIARACLVGLMRGRKIRVRIPGVGELTSAREEGARELLKDQTLRKAEFFPNKDEAITGRDRNAICKLFLDQFQVEVPRDDDEIANAVPVHFSAAREQLSETQALLGRLPGKPHPDPLTRLEKALESCRRDRKVEPTLKALKRTLGDLRDGLTELRYLHTDLTEEAVRQISDAGDFRNIFVDQLLGEVEAGSIDEEGFGPYRQGLDEVLDSGRPWEQLSALKDHVGALRGLYVARRQEVLAGHRSQIEEAISRLKLREGFDTLSQDDQHQVLQHVREGAPFPTKADSPVPSLSDLQSQFDARLEASLEKALAQLDELRESQGQKPTVTVALGASGRELETEADLERFLKELRDQLLKELQSGHRVRLK